MLKTKMKNLISEVNSLVAEREELTHCIALALLTRMNLFVLGETGQAKSYVIDLFRERIKGAKQFEALMSKEVDREELFGRLDLASIIPGNVARSVITCDSYYMDLSEKLADLLIYQQQNPEDGQFEADIKDIKSKLESRRQALAELHGGIPEINTTDKIPDSHICFLDEIFKVSDGILNSLLKALNERRYTNEGISLDIPVISFFSASNEIPNFKNPEEKILRPLYDRFQLKVYTQYVVEKENRQRILKSKQDYTPQYMNYLITLDELYEMQSEVKQIAISDSINELMDIILCELRKNKIHVSDRTFFDYGLVVQAEAWLNGCDTVLPEHLKTLVNYLWSTPEEIPVIADILKRLCENPLGDKINEVLAKAYVIRDNFENAVDKNKALQEFRKDVISVYDEFLDLKTTISSEYAALSSVDNAIETVESISKKAHEQTSFTYIKLNELKALSLLR